MFVYDGFLNLAKEARASGHWSYVIMNSYTAQLHLSMVCDLTLVEGWKAVPSYNTDFRSHVISTMLFVNNIPDQYRPHIVVYQNYVAGSDQAAVYSAVFGAARYGFCVELLSYSSFSSRSTTCRWRRTCSGHGGVPIRPHHPATLTPPPRSR